MEPGRNAEPASHSRLSTFETCPLQYRFRYVDRIPREEVSVESFLGTSIHAALERLYGCAREGRVPPLEEVLAEFTAGWRQAYLPHVRIRRTRYTGEDYRLQGEAILARYFRDHHPFDEDVTLGLEERIEADLAPGGEYRFAGVIDRLARDQDGTLVIHDYKTSSFLPGVEKLRGDRQLPLYQIAIQQQRPEEKRVRLVWHFVAYARRIELSLAPEELESVRAGALGLIERILSEKEFPPRESPLCDWCDYQAICPVGRRRAERAGSSLGPRPA